MNTILPHDIAITWVKHVPDDFHARFSAVARRYRYIIFNDALRPGIFHSGLTHAYAPLDADLMHQAAQCIVGKHDFTTFRASLCQSKSPVRTVEHVNVVRQGRYIIVDIKANAFLHHMVRNLVGSLMLVGEGLKPIEWIQELMELKDRKKAAATAKPNGLYLVKVFYPETFDLPEIPLGPLFLGDY
jgi:tRNA pseudouridine38-40 synthase